MTIVVCKKNTKCPFSNKVFGNGHLIFLIHPDYQAFTFLARNLYYDLQNKHVDYGQRNTEKGNNETAEQKNHPRRTCHCNYLYLLHHW